jgi:hypothetical protein
MPETGSANFENPDANLEFLLTEFRKLSLSVLPDLANDLIDISKYDPKVTAYFKSKRMSIKKKTGALFDIGVVLDYLLKAGYEPEIKALVEKYKKNNI